MKPTRPSWLRAIITIGCGLLIVKLLTGCASPFAFRLAGPDGSVDFSRDAKGGLAVDVQVIADK